LRELSEVLGLRLQRAEVKADPAPFIALSQELRKQLDNQKSGRVSATLAAAERKTDAASVIDALLEARVQLRAEKAWKLSDLIRDRLAAVGVQVEDSAGGSSWRWV